MNSSSPLLENISDTARWVAMYRALESDRPDAHFRDPYARLLAGEQGEEDRRYAELLRRMEAAGMVEHLSPPTEPPPAGWQPVVLEGEPLSETVIKMRREE